MRILLAIDDSAYSQAALEAVRSEFDPQTTEVLVVHALDLFVGYAGLVPMDPSALERILEDERKAAQALVNRAAQALLAAGFKAAPVTQKGDARSVILDQASTWRPDLIVLGSHGRKGIERFLMGSVSEAVLRLANCSVLIVRAKQQVSEAAQPRQAKTSHKGELAWQRRRSQKRARNSKKSKSNEPGRKRRDNNSGPR